MEKIRNRDPRSGINIPDPQHWTNNDLKFASSSSFFSMLFSRSKKAALYAEIISFLILHEKCPSDIMTFFTVFKAVTESTKQ
jgi:hypothetical protein